tara:strand:+ start:2566 stop:2895 length:330 start_codon:yes stop_codon:yes gene_type:complete
MKEEADWNQVESLYVVSEMELEDFYSAVEGNSNWNTDSPAHLRYLDRLCWWWEKQLKILRYMKRQKMLDIHQQGFSKTETGKFIALKRTRAHELIEEAASERLLKQKPF